MRTLKFLATAGGLVSLVACGLFLNSPEAEAQGHVLSVTTMPVIEAKVGSTLKVDVPVEIQRGYHVNSNTPSDEYLIPLRLQWQEDGALKPSLISFPEPHLEEYSFSPTPLSVFTEPFKISTEFKVPSDAMPGPSAINGKLRYQACNDRECLAPKTLNFTVKLNIVR